MRPTFVAALGLASGLLAMTPADAQEHRATRLGNPATRFSRPLRKADDFRVLLRGERTKADVAAILREWGYKGSLDDLDRAAASAEIGEVRIPSGTRLPFMASRKNGKPRLLRDVLWAGPRPIDAYTFEFSSECQRYRALVPKVCGNFWIEDLGRDTSDPKCAPARPRPVVSLRGASETCVTQPVEFTVSVQNPPDDNKVTLFVNGKELVSDRLSAGGFRFTFPGAREPGRYEIKAVSGGETSTTSVEVKPCTPTCGLTVTPQPPRVGQPVTIDASGSRVAPGVRGGIKSVRAEILKDGKVVSSYEMAAPNFVRSDATFKKGGIHTVRAVVTDEHGQVSENTCQAEVDVVGGPPIFAGAYFGKERLVHDHDVRENPVDDGNPQHTLCAEHVGFQVGYQPMIGEKLQGELAVGYKIDLEGEAHSSLFADGAVNYLFGSGFLGAGLTWWDIFQDDTRSLGILVQGGFDVSSDGRWQIVGQARGLDLDDLDNGYQLWGGVRFRPFAWK
jgi:hypothetical protein